MSNNIATNILLIGTGPMAISYAKVLTALGTKFTVVGRGEVSAATFHRETTIKPDTGGLENYLLNSNKKFSHAIVATGPEQLMGNLNLLASYGITAILIEKPAAISIEELYDNESNFSNTSKTIFVAYNRRFYSSVIETEKLIEEDGGLKSMNFEFTEWTHAIDPSKKAAGVMSNWFFANSTHVVDLAFFLAGRPTEWCAFSDKGNLEWHDKTNFSGAGVTEKNVLFAYLSNWESAGRWSVELLTNKRRIYLKPLEGIGLQMKGSVRIEEHLFDNTLDIEFKPGIYKQVVAFLQNDTERLLTIDQHISNAVNIYKNMLK